MPDGEPDKSHAMVVDAEEHFHDGWAADIDVSKLLVEESFSSITAFENRYVLSKVGGVAGKKLLDLGCGAGEASVYFALQGAEVWALDISGGMLSVVERLARSRNVSVHLVKGSAERLPIEDCFFDIVYGNGVLHHVDTGSALKEVYRVLKPGGKGCFIEPLAYNPAIKVYRRMAEDVRSRDEHPFKLRDFATFRRLFSSVEHKEMWFFSLYIFLWFFLVERVHPSKERYWKKVIGDGNRHKPGITIAKFLDCVFLTVFPFLRPLCWNTVVCVRK